MPGINVLSKDGPGQGQDGEKRKMLWAYAGLILYFFFFVCFLAAPWHMEIPGSDELRAVAVT